MSQFFEDIHFALRSLRKSPGFLLAVVGTLALGLGANAVIFAVVHASILRPLPFPEADELVWVWPSGNIALTLAQFEQMRPQTASAELTTFAFRSYSVLGGEAPREVTGVSVSTNHFGVFGVYPALGRALRPEDALPGAEPVAVISHELWHGQFGDDATILGRRVDLFTAATIPMVAGAFTGSPHTVVGVLPPSYRPFGFQAEVYTPLVVDPDDPNFTNMGELSVIGRMTSGSNPERVHQELVRLSNEIPVLQGLRESIEQDSVVGLRDALYGSLRPAMWLTLGAVALVLLIACSNVANLVLVRTQSRLGELAIRNALGAGRSRLVRQLLTESLLLSCIAATVGFGVAYLLLPLVANVLPAEIAPLDGVTLSWPVLAYTAGALALTALLSGITPAAMNTKGLSVGAVVAQRTVGSSRRRRFVNSALVVSEIALALVLLHGAGVLVKSFSALQNVDVGFAAAHVVTMRVAPSESRYESSDVRRDTFAQILDQVDAITGVESVGAIHFLPIADGGPGINFALDPAADRSARQSSGYRVVTPGYIETMGIPLLRGRTIAESDVAGGELVGMVNGRLAEQLWPGEDPLGRTIYRTSGRIMLTVVGVVGDVRQGGVGLPPQPEIYIPLSQSEWASAMNVVVRTSGPLPGLDQQLRQIVEAIDPNLPVTRVTSMEDVMVASIASPRFYGMLFSLFAVLALVLGGIGIYGVVSTTVGERRGEIGLRMALGATGNTILRRELLTGGKMIALGVMAGIVLAALASRALSSLLYEVSPTDPVVVIATSLILALVAVAGVMIPAARAARIDPLVAMRSVD